MDMDKNLMLLPGEKIGDILLKFLQDFVHSSSVKR